MKIVECLKSDKEIQELKKQLHELTGQSLGFSYDCYFGIDDYKEHLRECVKEGRIIIRPQDEHSMHRFDSIFKSDTTSR